ncbi:GH36-type glycosyl hydrolase domain-containing protein [Sporomusa acidovorans]|uniref:N,N'-diacetylchitobiose phosphorylase n=1 Tax=Sporomusa acidovorans (strain ATCC 49682 / DSM 3132 / Mol) TaxID=1123286 RepID=A0ABZ3J7D9_SPOA4|nr:glucoamylase family protein [Sporomusa acidovorans]OZC18579.1 N,N'-diacetylchitobiose phosphorylase [Sporomusa acidovorans DSM 3132]SDE38890.1 Cellobiose phosphorylase [Sporomusa acidovorans]
MILNTEQFRQKAHILALTHDPYMRRWPSKCLWRELHANVGKLRAFIRLLRHDKASCSQPAEEWLLDHAEFIEEQALVVRQQLDDAFLQNLPDLRRTGALRILSICADYLEQVDGNLDEDSLISYINFYQEVSVLTIAEAWAVPLILRIALLRRLAEVMELVRERREVCTSVERLLARLEASRLDPKVLKAALEEAGQDMPLAGAAVVYLARRLREWADDSATVREWLMCKLENGPDSLDRIVSYEYQLQAAYQMSAGNLVSSLRKLSRLDWNEPFERVCMVEHTLHGEIAGVYPLLDFSSRDVLRKRVEQLARRLRVPENLVAQQAVELAAKEYKQVKAAEAAGGGAAEPEPPRQAFTAYYLLEADGVKKLRHALKLCAAPRYLPETEISRRATGTYFTVLAGLFTAALLGFAGWISAGESFTVAQWAVIALALSLPASEWAVTAAHWLIECVRQPRPLLRYDFSRGVPPEAATMVVVPVIWSTAKEVQELADRLELHYLANRDDNIHFALLGDLADAGAERVPEDTAVLDAARASIEALNSKYSRPGGSTFHLFQRRRLWNPSERVWMGWERKRGKLVEFVELLKGRADTTFDLVVGDTAVLPRIRYVITLDADTELPLENAQRMIGTLHLPYNRPRLNSTRTRVIAGYGVLQPRIAISHGAALRSRFAALWSADPGIDPYVFAASDPYQDGLGQGIFTGKGIFDVNTFAEVLCERIPENRVLSHDLLEGGFLRAGLLADIELIDGHPAVFSAYQKRMHRWVRGDWQLLPWLFSRVRDRRGALLPVDLPPLARWQMIDNLRRSLLPPAQFAVLLLGLTVLPGSPSRWLAVVFVTMLLPLFRQLAAVRWIVWRPRSLFGTAGQILVNMMTLPFQSVLLVDAITRTLYRLFVSKRHLLEWVSAAEVERRQWGGRYPGLLGIYGGYVLVFLFALAAVTTAPALRWTGFALCALWVVAPLVVRWLDRPATPRLERPLTAREEAELRNVSEQIWAFFEDYVTETEHWLPPDNVQLEPPNGIAHRTSPTNIGLYLTCALAARDFGFIDTPGLIERLERTISTVEHLAKWQGHLYNWYDTVTLEPLPPLYVSTVDSGNFAVCLVVVKEGVAEWLTADLVEDGGTGAEEGCGKAVEALNVAFAEELAPAPADEAKGQRGEWLLRGQKLIARLETLLGGTDFRPLYDHKTKLFHLGYNERLDKPDAILYDLMASEARLSSFIAIALGQVPVSHWHALGRTMTRVGRRVALLSWSGTMFEYLMPWLFMRTYRNTVWDSTYQAAVQRQIEYARQQGVPFGVSESGYYAFDHQMNYQYRAFGVPGLGFKRGLEHDLVVAPYATILALPFAKHQGLAALRRLEELGARGKYGYFEAVDFTPERLPENRTGIVIRSFMAHHQGMSLLALANLLAPKKITERFHRDKRVQAAQLLLQERIPVRPKIIKHPAFAYTYVARERPLATGSLREYRGADTPAPEVCVLSNGTFTTVVTNSGGGFSRCEGLAVTRWREDPVLDNWGSYMYIRDVARDVIWSPAFQPCRTVSAEQRVKFSLDRATFMRVDDDIQTSLEICVSPEWNAEVRRLTLANAGSKVRILEVTTFLELALASPMADDAHPAFSKLFIQTAYVEDAGCLLAQRRPRRQDEKPLWAAHALVAAGRSLGPVEYDTDRAGFIGRGHTLVLPQGIRSRLRQTVGSVADPAFVMRRRVSIEPGEQVQLFAVTTVAGTRQEAIDLVGRFPGELVVERTFQLAWNRSQIELRHLHLTVAQADAWQAFASRVLYTPPLRQERKQSIAANAKGQSGLWAYGVSGDLPVILVRIGNSTDMPFVVEMLTGHEYLRRLGLFFDLVVLNESAGGYREELQEALKRAVEQAVGWHGAGLGGVFIINAGQLSDADRTLLFATARVGLRADGPSFGAQSRLLRVVTALPAAIRPTVPANRFAVPVPDNGHDWLFFNGWGGFSADGREYRIMLKSGNPLSAPWINVIANPRFGCLISELGTGHTWWLNSRECKLTPWSNDPVLDPPGEVCYLRDEESGELWLAAPERGDDASIPGYTVTHGRGFTCFSHERHGIRQEMTVFVPVDDPVKVIRLRLKNGTAGRRRLSVTYYAEWVLGVQRRTNASFIITEWDEAARMLLARNTYQEALREAWAFLGVYPGPPAPPEELSWTADRSEFLGRSGTWEKPAALDRERLSGQTGPVHDACGAVQAKFVLESGGEQTVYILLGAEHSRDAAVKLAEKYRQPPVCDQALAGVREFWDGVVGQIAVATPCPEMNMLLNGWLLYQALACRMWARSAFYQAGGAYGFRDQLQDSLALLHSRPDFTRAQILLHAAHQYEEGDVQHWWHEETQRGIRTRFADDLLWLPYAVARYVEHTGDDSILAETARFLHSEPLAEGEYERYEPTRISTLVGTILEHCLRAIDRAVQRFGEHGLPLIGIGDWNDGMSHVGAEGRGESVWLGWFLCDVLERFADLCRRSGDNDRAGRYRDIREQLSSSLDAQAWDGQWYRRAFTDAGQWLGSIYSEECRIDAIAQSWAVISGAAPAEKALQAMQSFDRELVDRELSVARLLTPPFERTEPSPGYIQGYPPGIRENGAQYTHGVIWSIIAWCRLGKGDNAFQLFQLLNPLNHTRTASEVRQYAGEPYVMAADVYTAEPHPGRAGWTWYTGAAGWMYQAGIEWILGLRRRGKWLYIRPCIPGEWPEFSASYRFGSACYHITVKNPSRKSGGVTSLQIEGREALLTEQGVKEGPCIELSDDGQEHHVVLVL